MKQFHITKLSRCLVLTILGVMMTTITSCSTKEPFIIKEGNHIKVDIPLERDSIKKITPWTTTKQEILNLFGPPTAIARKGKVMTFPPPGHLKAGFIEVDSETFFEPFSLKFKNTNKHIIYYYYHPAEWGAEENRLWLYINQTNGIVEDFIFRGPASKKDMQSEWE